MTKKVLLLNGPSQDSCDRFFGWPTSMLYAIAPSVADSRKGLLDVKFVKPMFDPFFYTAGKVADKVKLDFEGVISREEPNIIVASATYDSVYPTTQLIQLAKKIKPDVKVIFGGPHFDEAHSIKRFNDIYQHPNLIDVAIAGDGEFALRESLRAMSCDKPLSSVDWNNVLGRAVVYTSAGERQVTSGVKLELEKLPFMPIEFADISHSKDYDIFVDGAGNILPTIQMLASRGCPYTCNFCSESKTLAYPNGRSIDSVIEEIALRKSQGFGVVFFDDSTFGAHPRLNDLLGALSKTGMKFGSLNRFNHLVNPKVVDAYRNAGFVYMYCSIEQFDDSLLEAMHKSQNEKAIRKSVDILHRAEFNLGVSLLYGLPLETEKSVARTIDFVSEWVDKGLIKLVSESVLSYHLGTPMGNGLLGGFNRVPPNQGHPFNRFEEGQWYHPEHVTADYLNKIWELSEKKFSRALVRNRHSWRAKSMEISSD